MKIVLNLVGIAAVLAICWLISWNRKSVQWKTVAKAFLAEFIIALIIVKIPLGQKIVTVLSNGLTAVINCGNEGLTFVFGDLFDRSKMSVFIVQSLGNIIFVSALVSVLYYLGAIGFIVKWIGKGVGKIMGTTEVESFVAVANMFLGHTDSPILVSKSCTGNSDGISVDRKCAGSDRQHHGFQDHLSADRADQIHHGC